MKNTTKANNNKQGCITFNVTRHQNIAEVAASGILNLPIGPCSIELYYTNRQDVRLYINGKTRNVRILRRTVTEYFKSPDTKHGNIARWKIVKNEMNTPNNIIEEITVRVCARINNNR